ncbi:MAG: hypothetical protein CMB47_07020 [Euryarchaeota archaeon]|nr:hypothetical protein [Euryarchaeota archaeon]|tara:strand:- start:705 stop:959 length:255 start_codon:yes stop_codon:yes gene_type:complete
MSKSLSDHQDSHHYTYSRSWQEIENMLDKAERLSNVWQTKFYEAKEDGDKKQSIKCARNMKALEGVIKTLKWTLGDKTIEHPLS